MSETESTTPSNSDPKKSSGILAKLSRQLLAPLRRVLPDWAWRGLGAIFQFIKRRISRTVLFLVLALGFLIVSDEGKTILLLGPFEVPKSMSSAGVTETVVAYRIQDEIWRIRRQLDRNSRIDLETTGSQSSDLVVPGTGISLGQIRSAWRNLRGNANTISGEIIEDKSQIHFYVRMDGQAARKCSGPRDKINVVLGCAAGVVLEHLAPVTAARYYHSRNRQQAIVDLALSLRFADPSSDQLALSFTVEGLYHYYEGRYDRALFFWEEGLKIDPDTRQEVGILYYMGQAYRYSGRCDKAILKFREVLEEDDQNIFAYLRWGQCLRYDEDYEGAREKIQQAWNIRPYHTAVLSALGRLDAITGDLKKARANHEWAMQLNPKDPETYNEYGISLREFKKFDEAAALHRRAIELDAGYSYYHLSLAKTLGASGDLKGARRQLHLVLNGPFKAYDRARANRYQVELERDHGNPRAAEQLSKTAEALHPQVNPNKSREE